MKIKISPTKPHSLVTQRKQRGFTLVEMLLVITIIGILAALVIPKMMGRSEQARQAAVRADISAIKTSLDSFEVDSGFYPKSLTDLIQQPRDSKNWRGPYLDKIPQDPWGSPYVYAYPGKQNGNSFDISSPGLDGKSGTDDDIGNWTTK
ncbi:MAG: type II secretion system protein GspG [Pedosphaera sp.]|nr:type II secretion system protein GspG [Pedosphaera sp.]